MDIRVWQVFLSEVITVSNFIVITNDRANFVPELIDDRPAFLEDVFVAYQDRAVFGDDAACWVEDCAGTYCTVPVCKSL